MYGDHRFAHRLRTSFVCNEHTHLVILGWQIKKVWFPCTYCFIVLFWIFCFPATTLQFRCASENINVWYIHIHVNSLLYCIDLIVCMEVDIVYVIYILLFYFKKGERAADARKKSVVCTEKIFEQNLCTKSGLPSFVPVGANLLRSCRAMEIDSSVKKNFVYEYPSRSVQELLQHLIHFMWT